MLSFFRVIKFALLDIGRNLSLSFMTILILVLMMLSVNVLMMVRHLTNESVTFVKNQIDVSVYFDPAAADEKIGEVKKYVEAFPEVTHVEFINRETVLKNFREKHAANKEILSSLDEIGTNPLGPTMIVQTKDPNDYEKVIGALSVPEFDHIIKSKTFDDAKNTIQKIDLITSRVEKFSFVLTALFACIAFLVIFNTIRVSIFTQRTEISIKKLVGATNWFIRGPYIIEALIFSLIAFALTAVCIFFGSKFLDHYIAVVFGPQSSLLTYFQTNMLTLGGIEFSVVFFLTLITSLLAMRKYLRV